MANNRGRNSVRRGRRTKIEGLDAYINGMFRADSGGNVKNYQSNRVARSAQSAMVTDIDTIFPKLIEQMIEDGKDAAETMAMEFETFGEEVIAATPYHEDGPTDPPDHAAEVWKFGFEPNSKEGFTLTLWNPKDYMPFLLDGWSPQAPAGWLDALWADFIRRLS